MRVIIWRITLIIILLITLIGSIVLAIQEPNLPSFMGVIGAVGSILGAFVTTGLDITASRQSQIVVSHRAPTMEGASQRVTVERPITVQSKALNLKALTIAMTFGAMAGIATGVLFVDPLWGVPIRCAQWVSFFIVGVIYVVTARNELEHGTRLSIGAGLAGGILSGLIPAIVVNSANLFSKLILYPEYGESMCEFVGGCTPVDYTRLLMFGTCIVLFTRPLVAGIGGLVAASLLKER